MPRTVVWSDAALDDMAAIKDYLLPISPANAQAVIEALQFRACTPTTIAGRGRVIPEFEDTTRRELFVHEWRIMYRLQPESIRILRVVLSRRPLSFTPGSFEESEQEAYAAL
jgi:toxin ParE1/3/4